MPCSLTWSVGAARTVLIVQADRVSRRLAARPKLDIIYRSMTVGHFSCWESEAPARDALVLGTPLNRPHPDRQWVRRCGLGYT